MGRFTVFSIFQSGMVLQRRKPLPIWGTAPESTTITVSLCNEQLTAHTSDGRWCVTLPPQEASTDNIMTITCDDTPEEVITLTDISIGDVWLACGQSNMEFFLRYDKDWNTVRNWEPNPYIHVYNVPQTAFTGHDRKAAGYGRWMIEGDKNFDTFSAPGYSFARSLQPHIGVPVGIIGCNWGGSTATAWLDENCLKDNILSVYLQEYEESCTLYPPDIMKQMSLRGWEFEDSRQHGIDFEPLLYGRDRLWQERYMKEHACDPVIPMGPYHINRPGGLYHQMLEPLIPFSIKGVLWYQGETDAGHADLYDALLQTMIEWWRKQWQDPFPFLIVQLAPFGQWLDCDSKGYTIVRHKQELVSQTVPDVYMTSIMDIGSYYDIHPKEKMEVGRRLALLARGHVYGESITCDPPALTKLQTVKEQIILTFSHCRTLSQTSDKNSFVVSQNEKVLEIQHIQLQDNQIILTVPALKKDACIISLGWADYAEIHIHNEAGIPLRPFYKIIS